MTSKNNQQTLKYKARNTLLTLQSIFRWKRLNFNLTPAVFGNAMPKSGSHLVYQILKGITQIAPYRYVESLPVRMITGKGRQRSQGEILDDLKGLKPGTMGWGYLRSYPEYLQFFAEHPEIISFFVYRDPRDQLISSIYYAVDIHLDHAQHEYYSGISMDERIKTEILGRDAPDLLHLPNVRQHYEEYLNWLDCPEVLCLRFEDLIHDKDKSLSAILDHLERGSFRIPTSRETALAIIKEAIQPKKSATFRKGKSGGWREHFTEEHKQLFKETTGDLLIKLGYEENNDW